MNYQRHNTESRLIAIDILKLVSFLSIIIFHTYSAVYYREMDQEFWRGKILFWAQILPRTFSFSGFTIVAIFSFLRGSQLRPKPFGRKFLLFGVGTAVLFLTYSNVFENDFFWEWDIYHYLICVALSFWLIEKWPKFIYFLGIFGFALTWIPFWKIIFFSKFPIIFQHALIGVCDSSGRGGWPLLPWIGLPWAIYALGRWQSNKRMLFRHEPWAWLLFLVLSVPHLGAYFQVLVGPQFYCYTLRQEPITFWSHFFWIVFILRWSSWPALQNFFERTPLLRNISNLSVCRHFGSAYLIHLIMIWGIESYQIFFLQNLWAFDLAYLGALPIIELIFYFYRNALLGFSHRLG